MAESKAKMTHWKNKNVRKCDGKELMKAMKREIFDQSIVIRREIVTSQACGCQMTESSFRKRDSDSRCLDLFWREK